MHAQRGLTVADEKRIERRMVVENEISPSSFQLESWLTNHGNNLEPGTKLVALDPIAQGLVLLRAHESSDKPIIVVFGSGSTARNAIDHFCFFGGKEAAKRIHFIPSLEFDFHRSLLPNSEVLAERNIAFFHAINDPRKRIFVTTVKALLQKCLKPDKFLGATLIFQPNEEIERDVLVSNLIEAGYQRHPTAFDPGTFSVRGGVIDIFSPLYSHPFRIEFFGDLIEEIRFFDAISQRSLGKLGKAYVIPVSLSLVPRDENLSIATDAIKDRLDNLGVPKFKREEILEQLKNGVLAQENMFLFPLVCDGSSTVFDYFPKDRLCIWDGKENLSNTAREEEYPKLTKNFELFEKNLTPVGNLESLFLGPDEFQSFIQPAQDLFFEPFQEKDSKNIFTLNSREISLATERGAAHQKGSAHPSLDAFAKKFREWIDEGYRINVVSHTQVHADRFNLLFSPYGLKVIQHGETEIPWRQMPELDFNYIHVWQGFLRENRIYPSLKLVIVSEEEIFGVKKKSSRTQPKVSQAEQSKLISAFRDLKINDYVVHRDFGVGRYLGLKSMDFVGVPNDYVLLEYRDGDKLYIPVYRLNILQKYVGGEGASVALDKLGGEAWAKTKKKAERAIAELAAQFLTIQAKRKLLSATAFSATGPDFLQFEMEFPFDETPDQMRAIDDVMHDLSQKHPMDRLVCGDVGYGKTEVAMRAAYRAVLDNKQVAVLVPTTVLAFQHYESFKSRFKNTPARIEMISRFRTNTEVKKILADLKDGKIDILIGTHRLISTDIQFKDLALLIVDEEHRFGVIHKERLKEMASSIHVLSLTATPIPRTLNMAMTGIKEISVISTPPPDRLSVRTFVCRDSEEVIVEAVQNELLRDGQVFFVHNRIETIFEVEKKLLQLFPRIKIAVVHGQMDANELEQKMLGFYKGDFQILLTTAIIESGLDIPRANTIIIDKANYFGLAQLYQLRGRVGRSSQRAYCYLLAPAENILTAEAKERLQVIQRYSELGSGFNVASHDLEIRGAGDLLGKDQSGHINAIGVDLYFELLDESIRALRGQEKKIEIEPEITLKVAAYFPNDYLPDVGERVALYRRLSSAESEDIIANIETEIRDRLGPLPQEVSNLIGLMIIKLYLKQLHVVRMSCGPKRTSLQFAATTPASPEKLVRLIQSNPQRYSLTPDQKFVFGVENTDWRTQLKEVQELCRKLDVNIEAG
ncbi:MAG: transcription-repair coupling factor [Proteobacteria bacterium]|nr:transcription-repair coupling factor [Pseudomonadota bacterium]